MKALLWCALVFLSAGFAVSAENPSRLGLDTPRDWTKSADGRALLPPGGGAALNLLPSEAFSGSAEQWMTRCWNSAIRDLQLEQGPFPGNQGRFLTRLGFFRQRNGSPLWLVLHTVVQDGRGEAALFLANDEAQLRAQLPVLSRMFQSYGAVPVARSENPAPPAPTPEAAAPSGELPSLAYQMPPDFPGPPGQGTYTSLQADGFIQVYDFRSYAADGAAEFRRTLLRDWIAKENQEDRLVGTPQIEPARIPGADQAFTARFRQDYWGIPRERLRVAIFVRGGVALVDVNVRDAEAWNRYLGGITSLLASLRVQPALPAPPPGSAANGDLAGLYLATKSQFQPNVLGGVGSGSWAVGTEYYLLSPDGRVHRGRKVPQTPGGDISRFDYATAAREDPANAGTYRAQGDRVTIRLGEAPFETIAARRTGENTLSIYDVTFTRSLRAESR